MKTPTKQNSPQKRIKPKKQIDSNLLQYYIGTVYRFDGEIASIVRCINTPIEKQRKTIDSQYKLLVRRIDLCQGVYNTLKTAKTTVLKYNGIEEFPMDVLEKKLEHLKNLKKQLQIKFKPVAKEWESIVNLYVKNNKTIFKDVNIVWVYMTITLSDIENETLNPRKRAIKLKKERAEQKKEEIRWNKAKEKWMKKNCPRLDAINDDVALFLKQNKNIHTYTLQQLQVVEHDIKEKFIALTSIKDDIYNEMLKGESIQSTYQKLFDELNELNSLLTRQISIKGKTDIQKHRERLKVNHKTDMPLFRKMSRLLDKDAKLDGLWYENESRQVNVSSNESIEEYMQAYGRTIRGGVRSAEIVYVGQEDVDQWGYIEMSDKFVPFSIREIKQIVSNTLYHIYTFKSVTDVADYDYDAAITDRILLLNDKGIRT